LYDVIIVGGGPSGAIAALECVKKGYKTLILEKEKFPRDKPCGGALSEKSMRLLNSIGINLPNKIVESEYFGINVITPKTDPIKVESNTRLGVIVKRYNFDMYLIENAIKSGVSFKDGMFVKNIKLTNSKLVVNTTNREIFESKYIIGADGAVSTVARAAGLFSRINPRLTGLSLQANIPVETVNEYINPNNIYTYLGFFPFGYGWIFPNKKSLNIGIGGQMSSLKNSYYKFYSFFNKIKRLKGLKIPKPIPHLLPIGGFKKNIAKNRVFLVGDAAGFIDAMTGEGIYYAMLSGKFAAEAIHGKDIRIQANEYWKLCYNNIWKNLRASTIMALVSGIFPGLSSYQLIDPSISKHLIATTRGDEFYSKHYLRFFYDIFKKSPEYLYYRLTNILKN